MQNPNQPAGQPTAQQRPAGQPAMSPAAHSSLAVEPAGFWIRFVAHIIDSIIIAIPQYAILVPITMFTNFGDSDGSGALMSMVVSYGVSFGLICAYYGYFYTTKGASLGKLAFNIRVVNSQTGTKLTWGQAILRETIGKIISALVLGAGFIMAGFRGDKKALHDLMVGSQCLRKR